MLKLEIKSRTGPYSAFFGQEFDFVRSLAAMPNAAYVIDANVQRLYSKQLSAIPQEAIISFEATEENKSLDGANLIYDKMIERAAKRNSTLVAIGGGITQDVAGFAASTLYRGIDWCFVPTTLLAQADSCIGGKTSLNYKQYKNLLGTFCPPKSIFIETSFVKTLSDLDFHSGMGEVVKLHLIDAKSEADLDAIGGLARIRKDDSKKIGLIVQKSLRIKAEFIQEDEFDKGRRNLLNYGHCFGHALETASDYRVPHGIGVMAGILFAAIASKKRGSITAARFGQIAECVRPNITLNTSDLHLDGETRILEAMKKDKKRVGSGLSLVLPRQNFKVEKVDDFTAEEFSAAIAELRALLK